MSATGNSVAKTNVSFVVNCKIKRIQSILDSAATCSVIGYKQLCELLSDDKPILKKCSSKIKGFGNSITDSMGEVILQIYRRDQMYKVHFIVVKQDQIPLLSYKASSTMGFLKVVQIAECNRVKKKPVLRWLLGNIRMYLMALEKYL